MSRIPSLPINVRNGVKDAAAGLAAFVVLVALVYPDGAAAIAIGSSDKSVISSGVQPTIKADAAHPPHATTVKAAAHLPHRPSLTMFQRTDKQTALILMAAVFSALVAFNLAFFRHLRRLYARPVRRMRGMN